MALLLTNGTNKIQMGGRNTVLLDAISWSIPLVSDIPTIIFGADVTHPETGEDSSPSIAAVRLITTFHFCINMSYSSRYAHLCLGFGLISLICC